MEILENICQEMVNEKLRSSKFFRNADFIITPTRDCREKIIYGMVQVKYKDIILHEAYSIQKLQENKISKMPFKLISVDLKICYLTWPCQHDCQFETVGGTLEKCCLSSRTIISLYKRFNLEIPYHFQEK